MKTIIGNVLYDTDKMTCLYKGENIFNSSLFRHERRDEWFILEPHFCIGTMIQILRKVNSERALEFLNEVKEFDIAKRYFTITEA